VKQKNICVYVYQTTISLSTHPPADHFDINAISMQLIFGILVQGKENPGLLNVSLSGYLQWSSLIYAFGLT
jgi:hypothetical protein